MKPSSPEERPPAFAYQRTSSAESRQTLHAEGVALQNLAEEFGTPLYVYSAAMIRERFREFDRSFAEASHTVCYSVKANSNRRILQTLHAEGAGFDIVSGGELQRVLAANGNDASKVVFSGVGKQAGEIDLALKAGILLFNVESPSELDLLAGRALHLGTTAPFAVRVNPDVEARTHPYISTGLREHKFGVPISEATNLYEKATSYSSLKASGISVHIGSQITDATTFGDAMQAVTSLVSSLRTAGHPLEYVDCGGGLGISYFEYSPERGAKHVQEYAQCVLRPLRELGVHVLLEPGRWIIGPAGLLLTKVVYRKKNGAKNFVIVDAAMNDLMRPSLYGAHHEVIPVDLPSTDAIYEKTDIVGPVCETGDFFARSREFPRVEENTLLAILDTGAYGMALASNYNSRLRPAEVMVDGSQVTLIRRRETMADLLAQECDVPPAQ